MRLLTAPDGRRIEGVEVGRAASAACSRQAGTVVLAAGAVNSAALLLALGQRGLPRRRRQPLRRRRPPLHEPQFLGDARRSIRALRNNSVYQKTLGLNDFYFDDGDGGPPLGNVQLLGKITAPILKANTALGADAAAWPASPPTASTGT